ncbi:hypothetical protein DUI87_28125 [Hirundo rustica rustica]|uniref:Uncharacterized protein n=1 Tax=Hirundo rustica rustica TaxID=333673 RepID=A0A3M0J3B8_HIRRU|nr:hypothetical protein DUI87_28125 [Hirundo rustica rustica]
MSGFIEELVLHPKNHQLICKRGHVFFPDILKKLDIFRDANLPMIKEHKPKQTPKSQELKDYQGMYKKSLLQYLITFLLSHEYFAKS